MSRIANLLLFPQVERDFTNYFTNRVSALGCPEPIVFLEGAFERESRIDGEERGVVPVEVLVVRDVDADAEAVAVALEQCLRHGSWERAGEAWPYRVIGLDTTAPCFKERDGSGRYVWGFTVSVTVVRSI